MRSTEDQIDHESLLKEVTLLNSIVQEKYRDIISISSNLSDDLESTILERKSESILFMERESANSLVDLKKTSVDLQNNLQNYNTSDENTKLKKDLVVDLDVFEKRLEVLDSYIREKDEFNKYFKIVVMGLEKMAATTRNNCNDTRRDFLSTTSDTFYSDEFDRNNLQLVSSSPNSSLSLFFTK